MSDVRISDLPLILSGDIRSNNVLPIVDIDSNVTNRITLDQLKGYVNSGETFLYEVGSGTCSTQRVGVGGSAIGDYSIVAGGRNNTSSAQYSTVSGGLNNTSTGQLSTVSGGLNNTSSGGYSTISGGYCNTSSGYISTVSGGYRNVIGINGVINSWDNVTYGGTISGYFSDIVPSSTSSGLGVESTFELGLRSNSVSSTTLF